MCIQDMHGGKGCIIHGTFSGSREQFKCNVCAISDGKVIRYRLAGLGTRKLAKLAWPFVALALELDGISSHLADSLFSTLKFTYQQDPGKVSCS